jgi:nucleoside phosphorylase
MEPSGTSGGSSSNATRSPISDPSIEDYTIGWICALQEEYEASCRMLDDEFDGLEVNEVNDNNTYMYGCISGHKVVIGCLPTGRYGISSATSVAKDMVRSFPNLRFALMVGIGGGAPTRERDIRLGDVVVSVPQGRLGGVVQYDFGKRLSDGQFQQTGQLDAPPLVLLGVLPEMKRRHNDRRKPDRVAEHLQLMDDMPEYQRPAEDRLYRADFGHKGGNNCENCDVVALEERPKRGSSREVTIHYGIIASANSVMKDARGRDYYANNPELNVLCYEMEAGGLMNNFPCLVIRGICDYSDSHKNDRWHNFAALAAAAYARELLYVLKPQRVTMAPSWAGKIEERK